MPVPFVFGNATTSIPLTNLDANFNTGLTIGNTTVGLGNTVTTLGNVTLQNVTISSGTANISANITYATANAVVYSGSNSVGTTSSNLYFNGSNLGVGTNNPDQFGRSYTNILGVSSSGSAGIEVNAATGSQSEIDIGVNGVRLGNFTCGATFVQVGTNSTVPLQFGTNNLTAVTIDTSQNVGIGTSSPTGKLDVVGGNVLVGRFYNNAGRGVIRVDGSSDSSLQIYRAGSQVGWFQSDSSGTEINMGTLGAYPLSFYTNNTERMRIASNGDGFWANSTWSSTAAGMRFDGVNSAPGRILSTCNADYNLELYGSQSNRISFYTSAGGGTRVGTVTVNTTNTSYNTSSDQRLKEDKGIATDTSIIDNTKIHDFVWKSSNELDRGVFAQEAKIVKPNAVQEGDDELNEDGTIKNPWAVDYSKYVPDLIVYCQQLNKRIEQLEAQLGAK